MQSALRNVEVMVWCINNTELPTDSRGRQDRLETCKQGISEGCFGKCAADDAKGISFNWIRTTLEREHQTGQFKPSAKGTGPGRIEAETEAVTATSTRSAPGVFIVSIVIHRDRTRLGGAVHNGEARNLIHS